MGVVYSASLLGLIAAVALRWLLDPLLGNSLTLVTLYGPIALAAWMGGYLPATLVAGLGYLACDYLFIDPRGTLGIDNSHDFVGFLAYLVTSSIMVGLAEAMRSSRQKFRDQANVLQATFDSIGDAIITTDARGYITCLNPLAESLTGWRKSETVGKELSTVFRIRDDQTREVRELPIAKVLLDGNVAKVVSHIVLISRNGTECPIDHSAAPILSDDARPVGAIVIFRDVSARRRAEWELLRSERELASFFENASVGMHWTDAGGTILKVNQAELSMLGYSEHEYIGRNIRDVLVNVEAFDEHVEAVGQRPVLHDVSAQLRAKNGSIVDVLLDLSALIEDEGVTQVRCVVKDITEVKRNYATHQLLAAIIETTDDAVVSRDLDGVIQSWNAGAERIFGYAVSEAIGQHISLIIPAGCLAEYEEINHRIRQGECVAHFESVRVRKDGIEIPVSMTISPLKDASGVITGASIISRDFSESHLAIQRLSLQYAVTHALAEAFTIGDGATAMLRAVCEHLKWQVGSLWQRDPTDGLLRCSAIWEMPSVPSHEFTDATRGNAFALGVGLPGRVWKDRRAAWVPDVTKDKNFPRTCCAVKSELHGAFATPVFLNDEIVGVIEFFSHEIQRPDNELLDTLTAIGAQIGQYLERMRAEVALKSSEERFSGFMRHLPGLAWIKTLEGKYSFANSAAEASFGVPRELLYGRTDADIFPLDIANQFIANDEQALASPSGLQVIETLPHADGSMHESLVSKFPILGPDGSVTSIGGIAIDITEHRQAVEALRENEHRLHALIETAADAIITIDQDGTIMSLNSAAETMFGYTAEELLRHNVRLLMPEPFRSQHDSFLTNYRKTGIAKIMGVGREVVGQRKDGTTFPLELAVSKFQSGRRPAFTGIVRDITARKHEEQRRRLLWEATAMLLEFDEPNAMLHSLFSKIKQPLGLDCFLNYALDESGRTLHLISRGGFLDQEDLRKQTIDVGQFVEGQVALDSTPRVLDRIQESFAMDAALLKERGFDRYVCYPLKAGACVFGTLSFAGRGGESFAADDIEFLATLTHYVTVAIERLDLIGRLRRADRRKDEFLAMLAHELRNPLAPMTHMLELVTQSDDDKSVREMAHRVMDRQLRHLVRLVDDLLDVSRITRDKLQLMREHIELAPVLQQAVEISRPMIEAGEQRLTVQIPEIPIVLFGDQVRLAQLFGNLINNASKYTEKNGSIHIIVERSGTEVTVAVKDTGIGIASEMLPYVFDMFTQVSPSLERSRGGLGIGLSLVRQLVELHSGSVQAFSEGIGRGSQFTVRLPVLPNPTVNDVKAPTIASAGTLKCKRILVVDDNRDSVASLTLLLKVKGHTTAAAYDGAEAIRIAETFAPDVILLDIGLPELNGYDVCRAIRAKPWGTGIYLVAVTGWGQNEDRAQSKSAGFNQHLVKPVTFEILSTIIQALDMRKKTIG